MWFHVLSDQKISQLIGHLSYHLLFSVSLSCGSTIAENNTYWESGGSEVGSCGVTICPCSTNICKVR